MHLNQEKIELKASEAFDFSAITEAGSGVVGNENKPLETWQHFAEKGTAAKGGSAAARIWSDKTYIPLTIKDQCVDCLHCVVACPHKSIGHEIHEQQVGTLLKTARKLMGLIPGFTYDPSTETEVVVKGKTDSSYCKGCFVCGNACPTEAIHFVPLVSVKEDFDGEPLQAEDLREVFEAPDQSAKIEVGHLLTEAQGLVDKADLKVNDAEKAKLHVFNGSQILGNFVFQAGFDVASIYPITPNTGLIKQLKALGGTPEGKKSELLYRSCLSEEAGYAWLTGAAATGKRGLMAQGSQSLAQIYEHMNINPGIRMPIFFYEMTRALAPGTSIKPDHTTTMRTSDTGEIIIFGRTQQDNYDRSLLLLKVMESEGVWIPGRLVIKGFVETHALNSANQSKFAYLDDEQVSSYLGKPLNPFAFHEDENISIGILDLDARYAEQRLAIDGVLDTAAIRFDEEAVKLAKVTGRKPVGKVDLYPPAPSCEDLIIVSLDDPDMITAEAIADELKQQGISAGALSIAMYRPFPGIEVRQALKNAKAVCVLDYSNRSGRSTGSQFSEEITSALAALENPPKIVSCQVGLGGRALTRPYVLKLYRVLADIADFGFSDKGAGAWFEKNNQRYFSLGTRGEDWPETLANFDLPLHNPAVKEVVVVGRGGQGVLLLNGLAAGMATLRGDSALAIVGYGALQRGGGITLSLKYSQQQIRDYSDIVMPQTLVAFDNDIHLQAMLPQLAPGGTLIVDEGRDQIEDLRKQVRPDATIITIPAKQLAQEIYGNSTRTNIILFGALMAELGISSVTELLELVKRLGSVVEIKKEAGLLMRPDNLKGLVAGYLAYGSNAPEASGEVLDAQKLEDDAYQSFARHVLPADLFDGVNGKKDLAKVKKSYARKKKFYQGMFKLHPMVSRWQSMYIKLRGKSLLSGGDMACGGCGQINIFRSLFNYLEYLQNEKGKIYVSEQDGCGTVFTGLNRTSLWNTPYIRIAFETAHGVAAGLAHNTTSDDLVVSISGDGGFMQGIRSVEDSLHQQDPIFHLVVVNQVLGNTGGQATATTIKGSKTNDGHSTSRHYIDYIKYAENHHVDCAVASVVNMDDMMKKIEWGHKVVKEQRRPFMLLMNFTCLEQGADLAQSLMQQKRAMDAHVFNLYSVRFKPVMSGKTVLYTKKEVNIDWYPWTFGKGAWKKKLKEYAGQTRIMKGMAQNEEELEEGYGVTRGSWLELKRNVGFFRYWTGFAKSMVSYNRLTMARLIHNRKLIPDNKDEKK